MAWHPRSDRGQLQRPTVRPDGSLLVKGFAAREGILEYRQADGSIRRELVRAETLAASAVTLARAPVTLEHPREDVSPDNVARLGVGDVDGRVIVHDDGFVEVSMAVRRRDAVKAVRRGKAELSPGYSVRLDETPGNHPVYGPYDAEQIERRNNHLAIVDRARGGSAVRMRTDGLEPQTLIRRDSGEPGPSTPRPGGNMRSLIALLARLGGDPRRVDSDNETQLADAIGEAVAARIDEADARTAEAQAKLDAAASRADEAEAKLATAQAAEAKRADEAARADLAELAEAHKIDAKAHDSAPKLRRAIAMAARPALFEGVERADTYVAALVDAIRTDGPPSPADPPGRRAWAAPAASQRNDATPPPRQRTSGMAARWGGRPIARGGE